jgi:hypothetical protein
MQLHNLRIGWRSKDVFECAPNISRSWTINHKIKDIRGKKREKNTKNELILLF